MLRNYNHYISGGKDARNHHPSPHIHNVMRLTSNSLDIVRESNEKMPPILLLSQVAFFHSFLSFPCLFFLSIIIICFYFHPLFILLYLFIQIKGNLIHTFASNLSSNDFEMLSFRCRLHCHANVSFSRTPMNWEPQWDDVALGWCRQCRMIIILLHDSIPKADTLPEISGYPLSASLNSSDGNIMIHILIKIS